MVKPHLLPSKQTQAATQYLKGDLRWRSALCTVSTMTISSMELAPSTPIPLMMTTSSPECQSTTSSRANTVSRTEAAARRWVTITCGSEPKAVGEKFAFRHLNS